MRAAAPRWALSLADLCLLLLGFFVILHARAQDGVEVASSLRDALEGEHIRIDGMSETAEDLFEPGEAVLTAAARARFQRLGRRFAGRGEGARIEGLGQAVASHRLDRWELGAARSAAVARALVAGGVEEQNIIVSVSNAITGDTSLPQRLRVTAVRLH